MTWSLKYGTTTQTLAAWELSALQRTLASMDIDRVICNADGAAIDASGKFTYGGIVQIYRDATLWFTGRVNRVPRMGSANSESHQYEFVGPWWYLENLMYQQAWVSGTWDGATWTPGTNYKSRIILGQKADGTRLTTSQVVAEIVAYAIAQGVPIAAGTIDASVEFPFDEVQDVACAEAIRRVMRWIPDAVAWFDYSVSPPALNIRRRSNLTAVTVATGTQVSVIDITPRYDRMVPAVVINYEQTHEVDGTSYEAITVRKTPAGATGREIGAMVANVELAGGRVINQKQTIVAPALPTTAANWLAWMKVKHPWLAGTDITNIAAKDLGAGVTWQRVSSLANELTEGTVQSWMSKTAESDTVTMFLTYDKLDVAGGNVVKHVTDQAIQVKITATDAATQTYTRIANSTNAEPIPTGLETVLYNALNTLEWEGLLHIQEEECTGAVSLGNQINVAGSLAAWLSMGAMVQQIVETLETGVTQVRFGPPSHLGPTDLVELFRINRTRRPGQNQQIRVSGVSSDCGLSVDLGSAIPRADQGVGPERLTKLVIEHATYPITLDPATNGPSSQYKVFQKMSSATGFDWVRFHA